jgi:lysophospholipase L1-like esterase
MLIGDSMVSDCCGWGAGMYGYFKPNATVVNYGMPWDSTKIFLQSAEWEKMLLVKPNYVLMQFGYSDTFYSDPDRYTTIPEFHDNLTNIVQTVLGFGGVPIMVTLHAERIWDANGNVIPRWQDRNAVVKEVAAEFQTPLLDLYQLTFDLFNQLGPSGTQFMQWVPGGPTDDMHFSSAGAVVISRLVVNALPDNLGPYLTGIFDPPPVP